MNIGRVVLIIQKGEKKKKKVELEVRPLESHGYCVVNLGDTYAVQTVSSASSFSFVFAFILMSILTHLPTHILWDFFSL